MSRESKIFNAPLGEVQKVIKEYESFGWELLNISGNQVSLTRETQNKVYPDLVKFEAQYEELKIKLNNVPKNAMYKQASSGLAFFLLLLAIVPGVLYITYKIKERKSVNELNEKLEKERNALAEQMVEVCNTSRATFFAREN